LANSLDNYSGAIDHYNEALRYDGSNGEIVAEMRKIPVQQEDDEDIDPRYLEALRLQRKLTKESKRQVNTSKKSGNLELIVNNP